MNNIFKFFDEKSKVGKDVGRDNNNVRLGEKEERTSGEI